MSSSRERNNFIGKQVPAEVKALIKCLRKLDVEFFTKAVRVAEKMLCNSNSDHKKYKELTSHLDQNILRSIYPGIVTILSRALRLPCNKLKKEEFIHDLTELNIPIAYHPSFIEVLYGDNRIALDDHALINKPRFSSMVNFRWRIDVGISTTSLKRVLEPSILCSIKTSNNNEDCTIEITKEKFHELRYAVAEVLNHMQQLEKRSVLNIDT